MRIGILLTGDYSWAGGVYYSLNIIRLLQQISRNHSITIVVITGNNTSESVLSGIDTKTLEVVNIDKKAFLYKLYCKTIGILTGSNFRFINDINSLHLDVLYPVINFDKAHSKLNCKVIYWLFDFQHKFLPQLFKPEEIEKRDLNFRNIAEFSSNTVISSQDSKSHFLKFYSKSATKLHVYEFVSLVDFNKINLSAPGIHSLPDNYFIVCNQFWPHKNHLVVLKALKILKDRGSLIHIVFTGKYDDPWNKNYVDEIFKFIGDNSLGPYITLTGFLSRNDQLGLMSQAQAVIQPSLFEGWSTVIEDAKALNQYVIASSLSIHKEQLHNNASFFEAQSESQLADIIIDIDELKKKTVPVNYQINIDKCIDKLIQLFNII